MMIYFDGGSHVYGSELSDPSTQSMAAHLGTMYNATVVNRALEDSSNNQILQRTQSLISQCKQNNAWPDLIVIGFTEWHREDWFVDGSYCSSNSLKSQYPEQFGSQRQKYYIDYLSKNSDFIGAMSKYYNNVIYNLHTELFYFGVPHLFFNCALSLRCDREMITFDWAEFYLKPYQITFNYCNWCRYQGYNEITPGKFHYGSDANRAWAELLYNHIQQHNLLTKDEYGSLYNLGRQRRRHHGPGVGEWDEELLRPPHSRGQNGKLQNHKM